MQARHSVSVAASLPAATPLMWPRCTTAAKVSPCSVTATVSPVTGAT
jgi:hypothetical protein